MLHKKLGWKIAVKNREKKNRLIEMDEVREK